LEGNELRNSGLKLTFGSKFSIGASKPFLIGSLGNEELENVCEMTIDDESSLAFSNAVDQQV
jgi:hypothetical protein